MSRNPRSTDYRWRFPLTPHAALCIFFLNNHENPGIESRTVFVSGGLFWAKFIYLGSAVLISHAPRFLIDLSIIYNHHLQSQVILQCRLQKSHGQDKKCRGDQKWVKRENGTTKTVHSGQLMNFGVLGNPVNIKLICDVNGSTPGNGTRDPM